MPDKPKVPETLSIPKDQIVIATNTQLQAVLRSEAAAELDKFSAIEDIPENWLSTKLNGKDVSARRLDSTHLYIVKKEAGRSAELIYYSPTVRRWTNASGEIFDDAEIDALEATIRLKEELKRENVGMCERFAQIVDEYYDEMMYFDINGINTPIQFIDSAHIYSEDFGLIYFSPIAKTWVSTLGNFFNNKEIDLIVEEARKYQALREEKTAEYRKFLRARISVKTAPLKVGITTMRLGYIDDTHLNCNGPIAGLIYFSPIMRAWVNTSTNGTLDTKAMDEAVKKLKSEIRK